MIIIVILVLMFLAGKYTPDKSTPLTASNPNHETVVNSPWNGSVWQVEHYLKKRLKDPDSFQAVEWGVVVPVPGGTYQVRCVYRAKNSFGGYVVEQVLADLDRDGNVTKMVPFKG